MESHEELRPYLFAIAYRMLGSVTEAEDVVQAAFLRYHEAKVEAESPKAYLATVTTRLAIDELRSARARREVYPGQWLPEPLVDDDAAGHAETADSLSLAFLHLLEQLSPVERAVFLLREVFDRGRQARARGFVHPALVNGDPGTVFYRPDGRAVWVTAFEIVEGAVVAVRSVLNPDKLTHIPAR
jgi:RNA polymerase sigma factor (sigma-70 family)